MRMDAVNDLALTHYQQVRLVWIVRDIGMADSILKDLLDCGGALQKSGGSQTPSGLENCFAGDNSKVFRVDVYLTGKVSMEYRCSVLQHES